MSRYFIQLSYDGTAYHECDIPTAKYLNDRLRINAAGILDDLGGCIEPDRLHIVQIPEGKTSEVDSKRTMRIPT